MYFEMAARDIRALPKLEGTVHVNMALIIKFMGNKEQIKDFDFLLNLGELFTLVVYGQLILENAKLLNIDDKVIDQIFDVMIRDFSKFALQLYTKGSATLLQQNICKWMIKRPVVDGERFKYVWESYVYSMKDQYEMNL